MARGVLMVESRVASSEVRRFGLARHGPDGIVVGVRNGHNAFHEPLGKGAPAGLAVVHIRQGVANPGPHIRGDVGANDEGRHRTWAGARHAAQLVAKLRFVADLDVKDRAVNRRAVYRAGAKES